MTRGDFFLLIDDLIEVDAGTVSGNTELESLEEWDSLALIGFVALLDEHFSQSVPASRISDCKTVSELADIVGGLE